MESSLLLIADIDTQGLAKKLPQSPEERKILQPMIMNSPPSHRLGDREDDSVSLQHEVEIQSIDDKENSDKDAFHKVQRKLVEVAEELQQKTLPVFHRAGEKLDHLGKSVERKRKLAQEKAVDELVSLKNAVRSVATKPFQSRSMLALFGQKVASNQSWVCENCTLENNASLTNCEACATAKNTSWTDEGWVCESCTLANASSSFQCEACGAPQILGEETTQALPDPEEQVMQTDTDNDKEPRRISFGLNLNYDNEDDMPKYSKSEVDDIIAGHLRNWEAELSSARQAVAQSEVLMKKHAEELLKKYDGEMAVIQTALERAEEEILVLRPQAAKSIEQQILLLELAQRLDSFETENRLKLEDAETRTKEKHVQLDAITSQLLSMKMELDLLKVDAASYLKKAEAAETVSAQLGVELQMLQRSEKEKRETAVQKMKEDMKKLAEERFAAANKQFMAVQARCKKVEAELGSASKELTAIRGREARLKKEATEASSEINALREGKQTLEADMCSLKTINENLVKDRDAAQETLGRLVQQNNALKAELEDVKGVCEELMGMLEGKK